MHTLLHYTSSKLVTAVHCSAVVLMPLRPCWVTTSTVRLTQGLEPNIGKPVATLKQNSQLSTLQQNKPTTTKSMDNDFHSLSKVTDSRSCISDRQGVFVIPFQPDAAADAGPSRPLEKTYAAANKAYEDAYWVRLEILALWSLSLTLCSGLRARTHRRAAGRNRRMARGSRRPASVQARVRDPSPPRRAGAEYVHTVPSLLTALDLSPSVTPRLSSLEARSTTLNGRDMPDLASATRAVAVGFLGEAVSRLTGCLG